MYSKSNSTSFLVKKWSRWWSKNPTFRSSSHSFWSSIIYLRSRRFADSWLKFGENRSESNKIRKKYKFISQNGQIRTNTDEHYFFSRIFAPSEVTDAAESFPYRHPQIPFASLNARKGKAGNLWGEQTDLISKKPAGRMTRHRHIRSRFWLLCVWSASALQPLLSLPFFLSSSSFFRFSRTRLMRILSCRISSMPFSPIRCLNSTSSVGAHGALIEKESMPQKYW